ncbi:MAG: type II secretion system F family protein [Methylococcaceae bacterium]|nr:type II secretion system F family protein [Methylococcaceae bacterium]
MPKTIKDSPLSAETLAILFTKLKTMESAGLPAFQAVDVLQESESALKQPLKRMQNHLRKGMPVSEAGYKAGIFNSTHKTLIHAAESSGTLAAVYGQLASYYSGLSSRIKKVKSRLYLPVFVLTVALFVQPIPALVQSDITPFDYLSMTVGRLMLISASVYFLIKSPRIFESLGLLSFYDDLLLKIPAVSGWIIKRQINGFYFILALMLEAGVAFSDALPKAVDTIKNTRLQACFKPALAALGSGGRVTEILSNVSVLNRSALQIINSSEHSGQLASGLQRYTRLESETLNLQDEALAEWLPRAVYTLICIWMAYSIVGSNFGSIMPTDL